MKFSLVPKEEQFFDLIEGSAQYMVEAASALDELVRNFADLDAKLAHIDGLEHAADEITHTTLEKLETTFITPFDREDIHHLVLRLDDVVDMITTSASRMRTYRVVKPHPAMAELTRILRQQTTVLHAALGRLRNPKHYSAIRNECIEVHRLENEADDITHAAIGDLFERETNAIELIRSKEILESLETVTDCGEDVANVIQGIVVKNT